MSEYISARSVLITGANRGLGLEIVKQLLRSSQPPLHLICSCRDPATALELQELASQNDVVKILQLDIAAFDQHEDFVYEIDEIVKEEGLNLFINCASRFLKETQTLENTTAQGLMDSFNVNAIAPFMLTKALLPALRRASAATMSRTACAASDLNVNRAAVINISAQMASIAHTSSSYGYMFRASKAALNMLTKCLSFDLAHDGILVVAVHPGWALTEAGSAIAMLDKEHGAGMVLATIAKLSAKDSGTFLNYKGEVIPW